MKHTIDTGVDKAMARTVLDKAMARYLEKFKDNNPQFRWTSDTNAEFSFSARGLSLSGTIVVRDAKMDVEMAVPLLMRPFQGKVMSIIEEQVQKWAQRAKDGEL